jgi:FixJ family two-component response regulator
MASHPVYLIDDDDAMLASTQFLLDSVGIPATSFSDPFAFLHAVGSLPPGCVLTDLRMPSMSGLELHGALATKGIGWPLVLMSGHSEFVPSETGLGNGVVAMVEKPFTLDKLMSALDRAFDFLQQDPSEAEAET